MNLTTNLKKAAKDPARAWSVIMARIRALITRREFSGSLENRSDSDDGLYVAAVRHFLRSDKAFTKFKRHPTYQSILEHTTYADGQRYLDIINEQSPDILASDFASISRNDDVGGARLCKFPGVPPVSPSTLYYAKVASDLKVLFNNDIGRNIAEIGVGYGGQALILDSLFDLERITLYDLEDVCKLTTKYLESFVLRGSYKTSSLNQEVASTYDLVLSNFAFSELPKALQLKYVQKVLGTAKRGYLTMNSGQGNHTGESEENRLVLSELERVLPKFEILSETPRTSPHNYVIVWGHD